MINPIEFSYVYFAGGCFWCIEAIFENLNGVEEVISGYAGGLASTASYKIVCQGHTKHVETCKIKYDPNIISFDTLLEVFFLSHNPTELNRQGNDIGSHYQSTIFYCSQEEKSKVEVYIDNLLNENVFKKITTRVLPFKEFFRAEESHQNYFKLNPNKLYCSFVINPKLKEIRKKLKKFFDHN